MHCTGLPPLRTPDLSGRPRVQMRKRRGIPPRYHAMIKELDFTGSFASIHKIRVRDFPSPPSPDVPIGCVPLEAAAGRAVISSRQGASKAMSKAKLISAPFGPSCTSATGLEASLLALPGTYAAGLFLCDNDINSYPTGGILPPCFPPGPGPPPWGDEYEKAYIQFNARAGQNMGGWGVGGRGGAPPLD